MKTCTIEGCTMKVLARGWCSKHYDRWYTKGDPNVLTRRENGTGGPDAANGTGYIRFNVDGRIVRNHVLVAERALGKELPAGVQVHHVDGNKQNDANTNLVICQDDAYHKLLHQRTRAFKACGNAAFRHCHHCKTYDDTSRMAATGAGGFCHRECRRIYNAAYQAKRKSVAA